MKKGKIITALALTMAVGLGATAYAATAGTSTTPVKRLGLGRITSMRGFEYVSNVLKSKLGLTDEEISNALGSGKTLYDLAIEKGMTQDQLKASLLEEKSKAIDDAVSKGTITAEEGAALKANLNTNIANCAGSFGQRQGNGQGYAPGQGGGFGRGMRGKGCRGFNN